MHQEAEATAGEAQGARRPARPASRAARPRVRRRILRRYGRRGMRFVRASAVRLLVDAAEAFPEMLDAIRNARDRVEMETYILRDDAAGRLFQEALLHAAERGVRVRLLYDWLGSRALPARFVRTLTDAGVAVAAFHPLVLSRPVWVLNKRDHRKILVVDEAVSFTGGLNIGREYMSVSDGGEGWRDTHVRLDGPEVAREMLALFEYAWLRAEPQGPARTRATRIADEIRRRWRSLSYREGRPPPVPPAARGVAVSIVGNELPHRRRRIHRAYLRAIAAAERYVLVENAYFIPGSRVRRALIRAARRGVRVGVVVGAQSDVPITAYATRWMYEQLLAGGVRLYEWPASVMHAKTAVIDDAWSIVGSYNFDHRSLFHQLESVAVVADPAFAASLRDQTRADISRCREVRLETHLKRPWWRKLLEYAAYLLRRWM